MQRLINRYLVREVLGTWLGVTAVLLVILVTTRFARFLGDAAAGKLPQDVVLILLGLTVLFYLVVLIPPSFFLAVLLTLGRLYRDSEMAALAACGVGSLRLYRPLLHVAVLLAVLVGLLSLIITPWTGQFAYKLRKEAQAQAKLGLVEAGRFKSIGSDGAVIYTASVSDDQASLHNVFIYYPDPETGEINIVTAARGFQRNDRNGERRLVLEDGHRYVGVAGRADFQVSRFAEYGVHLQMPREDVVLTRRSVQPTLALLGSDDPGDRAELQWRLSVPLSIILLALLAVPLGKMQPRQGRYARLFWGVLVYIIYFNALSIAQVQVERGLLPPSIGLWPVHVLVAAAIVWMLHREGSFRRLPKRAAP